MANNFDIKDFTAGTAKTIKSTDNAGVHTPHHNVDTVTTVTTVAAVTAISNALPAGTNAIGKLAANSGVDIGDVDVTSVPADPFGVNADAASVTGSISAKLRAMATALGTAVFSRGSGATDAGTLRAVLTTDSPGVTALGQTTKAASLPVTVASDQNPAHDAVDSVPPVKVGGYAKAAAPTDVSADADIVNAWFLRNGAQAMVITAAGALIAGDATNGLDVDVTRLSALVAGSAIIGKVGIDQTTPGTTNAVNPQPHTAGGLSIFRSIDLDEGTLEVVKASAGQVYSAWVTNTATATRWIKFYDATSGTAGTGTPVITIGIPGNSSDDIGAVLNAGGYGLAFATGICVGAVTGVADNDTGAPGANDVIINVFYK